MPTLKSWNGSAYEYVDGRPGPAGATGPTGPTGPSTPASSVVFTPTGNIAATNVQSAIAEVDSEKVTGTVKLTVASSAPSSPATGDLWVDTT